MGSDTKLSSDKKITVLDIDEKSISVFRYENHPLHVRGGMHLTERFDALNLRFRESLPGYRSDWHVAGDPTLIIVQRGCLRIYLRDGSFSDFSAGECFIAQDYLPEGIDFDDAVHGHRAEVIGDDTLVAVHIKLNDI